MFKLDFEKAEEPEIKLPPPVVGSSKRQEFKKSIYICSIHYAKVLERVDHNKLGNSERVGNIRPPYLSPEKHVCRWKQQLELDMEQWTHSKLGKEYVKAVYCHPTYLTYM